MSAPHEVEIGQQLPPLTVRVNRADLIRYAGASLDFNPVHWNERFATEVGLPGVIAHGMLTMAFASRVVTDWVDDPTALLEHGVRFTKPVVIPDDPDGTEVEFTGTVADKGPDGTVRVKLSATCAGKSVLARAYAVLRLE